jgi:FSR family fosmidomycin resistance protein-like MFS transporter
LDGGVFLAVPGLAAAAVLASFTGYLGAFAPEGGPAAERDLEPTRPRGLALLLLVVGLRSVAHMGLFTFVPLYEISRGNGAGYGTRLLALFLLAGALGTLLGGPLADRFGRRTVLIGSFVVATPLILVYALAGGLVGAFALVLSGAAVIGTFGVSLVMSQEYMPGRVGMASGLSIGLAIGLGGVSAVSLGAVADAVDLETAVVATALGPALAIFVALALPPLPRRHAEPAAAPV